MYSLVVPTLALALGVASSVSASPAGLRDGVEGTKLVPVLPQRVFTPKGFDDNDNSQIVLVGEFPNTCYRMGPEKVTVDPERHEIHVRDQAHYFYGMVCLQTTVPYTKVIDLGMLRAGDYRVVLEGDAGVETEYDTLPVRAATKAEPDDYLYADIDDAFIAWRDNNTAYIVLRGDITNTCSYLKEVKVEHEPGDVLVVLPIAGMNQGPDCAETHEMYERWIPLVDPPAERTLLHVRSLHGRAINKVFRASGVP